MSDVYVCKEGTTLSVEQAKLLKLLGHKQAKFSLDVLVHRNKKGKVAHTDSGRDYLARMKM